LSKTIFIVEDDENIRVLVNMALTSFSYAAVAFDNAEDALAATATQAPDMFLLDIMLPGISGLEAIKQIRNNSKTRHVPIILLTAKDTELDKVIGLDCGADDYLAKPFGVMELGARIRSVFRRTGQGVPSPVNEIFIGNLYINLDTREVLLSSQPLDFTYKEYELLLLLIRERGRVVPREELLQKIWGVDFVGESRTLDIHIRSLRQKLGDDAEHPTYIKTVRNVGYRFIGEQQQ